MPVMTLGTMLRLTRERSGLSQEAMGRRIGVARQTIWRWETDVTCIPLDMFLEFCRVSGGDAEHLIHTLGKMKERQSRARGSIAGPSGQWRRP